jgi:hypothetical protein
MLSIYLSLITNLRYGIMSVPPVEPKNEWVGDAKLDMVLDSDHNRECRIGISYPQLRLLSLTLTLALTLTPNLLLVLVLMRRRGKDKDQDKNKEIETARNQQREADSSPS